MFGRVRCVACWTSHQRDVNHVSALELQEPTGEAYELSAFRAGRNDMMQGLQEADALRGHCMQMHAELSEHPVPPRKTAQDKQTSAPWLAMQLA